MRGDRLVSIVLLLQTYKRMTAQALAERLEVSERTIYRDMDALSNAGIPVVAERGKNGGWSLLNDYRTDLTGLKAEEARALFISPSVNMLSVLGLEKPFYAAQQKLAAAIPHAESAREVWNRIHVDTSTWRKANRSQSFDALAILKDAIWENRKLNMNYRKADGTEQSRVVEPLGLVLKGAVWYFVAQQQIEVPSEKKLRTEKQTRTFRVSRIVSIERLEETFERPTQFDLETYWTDSVSSFVRNLPEYIVEAEVERSVVPRLTWSERMMRIVRVEEHDVQQKWVPVTLSFDTEQEALEYGLGLGARIKIVRPTSLRRKLIEAARAVLALNGADFSSTISDCDTSPS